MTGAAAVVLCLDLPAMGITTLGVTAGGVIVAALWGVSDFLGGLATRKAPAFLVVAIAHGLSLAALVLLAVGVDARIPSERTAMWGLMSGLSGGGALIVFYHALALGEMGMTAAITGTLTAVVPVIFSWMTEGRPEASQIVGFVIAIVAICLIAYEPRGRPRLRGLGLAVIAGLGFGVFLVASKFASQGALVWPLALSRLASASLAVAVLLAARRKQRSKTNSGMRITGSVSAILLLAGAAGLLEASGNLLYMQTTLIGRLDVAAVLASLYPAATILLAVWLLKERATRSKTIGMALALVSVIVISL